mmetsp:Transcript_37374/g.97979  ORF Transcript_37374/g.97979 Transcript_37374/m.97979 type:complete len:244 (+) Transcript_37374:309-1040(+)
MYAGSVKVQNRLSMGYSPATWLMASLKYTPTSGMDRPASMAPLQPSRLVAVKFHNRVTSALPKSLWLSLTFFALPSPSAPSNALRFRTSPGSRKKSGHFSFFHLIQTCSEASTLRTASAKASPFGGVVLSSVYTRARVFPTISACILVSLYVSFLNLTSPVRYWKSTKSCTRICRRKPESASSRWKSLEDVKNLGKYGSSASASPSSAAAAAAWPAAESSLFAENHAITALSDLRNSVHPALE